MKACIFPGHGAQYRGMGKDLYDNFPRAREVFSCVDDLLGIKISQICFEGTEQDLRSVYFQQLAILATCLAAFEVFKEKDIGLDFLSGLSLGEYICLYPAGVLDLEGLVYLIKARAEATQRAFELCPSSMFAVMGLEKKFLEQKGEEEGFYIANINTSRQIIISLKKKDRERIRANLEDSGARVVELEVEGGFHSPLMDPAKEQLRESVDNSNLEFRPAKIPIVSNVTAREHTDSRQIRNNLIEQLTSTVLWLDCAEFMIKSGVEVFFEIGPSRVLHGLMKKINPRVKVVNIEKKKDLDKFL